MASEFSGFSGLDDEIDGHIITGWKGKFPSPYLFTDKPIDNKKGALVIW
jgi:hypothetical protein